MNKKLFGTVGAVIAGVSLAVTLAAPASAATNSMSGTQSCVAGAHVGLHGLLVNGLDDVISFYAPSGNFLSSYKTTKQTSITTGVVSGSWLISATGSGLVVGSTGSSCVPQV